MEIYANASVFVQQLSQNKHTDLLLEQQLCHTLYVGIAWDLDNPGQKTTFKVFFKVNNIFKICKKIWWSHLVIVVRF